MPGSGGLLPAGARRNAATGLPAWLAALDDESFIATLYFHYLNRAPDVEGLAHYRLILGAGRARDVILRDFANSPEAQRKRGWRKFLAGLFGGKRVPHPVPPPRLPPKPFHPAELSRTKLPRLRIALIGTCIAEHLAAAAEPESYGVQHWLLDAGPHAQLPLLDAAEHDGIVVQLTLRTLLGIGQANADGDLFHLRENGVAQLRDVALALLETTVAEFLAGLPEGVPVFFTAFVEPVPQSLMPQHAGATLLGLVREMNRKLAELLSPTSHGFYVEVNDLLRYHGDAQIYDGYQGHASHAAILPGTEPSQRFYREVWARIAALWRVFKSFEPVKLIITDLDNTLWIGVAAEAEEIVPWQFSEGWPLGYAEALLTAKARGILLAIASKNDEAATRERFRQIWGDKLRLEDFCCVKIGWQPKSQSIAEILAETNILPDHTLFIDDSPLEIAEIAAAFPRLRSLTVPAERWRHVLLYAPETQVKRVSDESARRTELIHAKLARDEAEVRMSRAEFLQSLGLRVGLHEIRAASQPHFARAMELLNKTNQFNTTGQRWTAAELEALFAGGGWMLAVTAKDRFAEHGLIGLILIRQAEILQAVLSCRVFGLGIETAMLNAVQTRLEAAGFAPLTASWRATGRNHTSQNFFADHGWRPVAQDPSRFHAGEPPRWPGWIAGLE